MYSALRKDTYYSTNLISDFWKHILYDFNSLEINIELIKVKKEQ